MHERVTGVKRGKKSVNESRLVLVLFVTGVSFWSQLRSVVRVKPITLRHYCKNSHYVIITKKHDESAVLNASF